jgi:hypothetical protein
MKALLRLSLAASLVGAAVIPAHAQPELLWGGGIQTDTHLRVEEVGEGPFYGPEPLGTGVARNEGRLKLKLSALGDRYTGVADIDFVWLGVARDLNGLSDLGLREKTDPYRLETHDLYIDAPDAFGEGIDLRVGFQKVLWGVADQFNPTNNLNPEDLEDPLLFGDQQANFMVKLDWSETYGESSEFTLTAVVIPVFKPALLPGSAALGLAQTDRLPFVDARWNQVIASQQALASSMGLGIAVTEVRPDVPEPTFENVQAAAALSTNIGEHDVALSYYVGRHDLPLVSRQDTVARAGLVCDPMDETECLALMDTAVTLSYPRMQVIGLNVTGEIDLLGWISDGIHPLGYRLEAGLFLPEGQRVRLVNDFSNLTTNVFPSGEYGYEVVEGSGGQAPEVLTDQPFAKWTLGLDYSIGEHVYVNAQWVHGLVDEFGAGDFITEGYTVRGSGVISDEVPVLLGCSGTLTDGEGNPIPTDGASCGESLLVPRLADYLVLGVDTKFMNQSALFRLFTIFALNGVIEDTFDEEAGERVRIHHDAISPKGFSMVVFPSLGYNFGDGLEMTIGAFFGLGEPHTKFGDPATGGDLAWGRASYRF